MTVLARSLSAASFSAASARAGSPASSSMSKTLPWRTLATPCTPSERSAPSIALPCGSRTPDFSVTVTRAFTSALDQHRAGSLRALAFAHDAEPLGHLGIGLDQAAHVAAEAVL